MKLKTNCPACQASLSVKPELVGRTVKCPACKHPFTIESARTPTSEKSLDDAMGAWFAGDSAEESSTPPSSPPASLPSTVSRFEIREKLGEGGFGSVYRAWDPVLDRETALKVPHASRNVRKEFDRILNEAKAAARLRHPNIVAVFEVGTATEQPFIAAEFVQGKTLSSIMKDPETRDETDHRQLVEWLISISRGLAYAHREGIVHRDVKPHNVLIDETGRALLADFGLAMGTETDSDARQNAIVGTLGYMSPEQASGDQSTVGPASDQYALGVILFEMLTGKRPFEGNSLSLIDRIINEETPRPSSVADNVNRDLECICMKALSKQAASRFDSCDAFADDVQRWLDGELVEATHPTWLRRIVHWGRKRPQLAAWSIAGASLILLATGTTITIAIQQKLENDRLAAAAEAAKQEITSSSQDAAAAKEALAKAEQERLTAQAKSEATEYAAELNRIRTAITENRIEDAHQMLDRIPWNKRHVEHGLLRREAMGTPYVMRHGSFVKKLSWSRDGRILASVGQNAGAVRFWSGSSGRAIAISEDRISQLRSCEDAEFSPTSDVLWTLSTNGQAEATELMSWKIAEQNGQIVVTPTDQEKLLIPLENANLRLDPSGKVGCVFGQTQDRESELLLCDLSGAKLELRHRPDGISGGIINAAFRNGGTELVCQTVEWTADRKRVSKYFTVDYLSGEVKPFEFPVVTIDEEATTLSQDQTIMSPPEFFRGERPDFAESYTGLRSLASDQMTATLEVPGNVRVNGFQKGRIEVPDAFDKVWRGHTNRINCFAQRPDGKCLASASADEIRLWPLSLQTRFGVTQNQLGSKSLGRVSRNHDGSLAACAAPEDETGELPVWSTTTGEVVKRLPGHRKGIQLVRFHPLAEQLISVDGEKTLRLWDLVSGEVSKQWTTEFGGIFDVAFSPDGTLLAIVGESQLLPRAAETVGDGNAVTGMVTLWNPETGTQTLAMAGHTGRVTRAEFLPDGSQLVTASDDKSVRTWSVADGKELAKYSCEDLVPIDLAVSVSVVAVIASDGCTVPDQFVPVRNGRDSLRRKQSEARTQVIGWSGTDNSRILNIPESIPRSAFRAVEFSDDGKRMIVTGVDGVSIHDGFTGLYLHSVAIPGELTTIVEEKVGTYTVMVPHTETRSGIRKVSRVVTEPKEETYTVQNNGQAETRSRTVNVARTVMEDVPYTYNVTVFKPETRATTVAVSIVVRSGVDPSDATFLPNSTGVLISNMNLGMVFDSQTPWSVRELSNADILTRGFVVSPDGGTIASFGSLNSNCEHCSMIDLWNATTGEKLRTFRRAGEEVRAIAFHPANGNLIIAIDKPEIVKEGAKPDEASRTESWILAIDSLTGQEVQKITSECLYSPVVELAVGAKSENLLARSEDGLIHLCSLSNGAPVTSSAAAAQVSKIALSSDGELAILQESGRVTVCLTASPEKRWPMSIPQPGSDQSGYVMPVTSFDLSQDAMQLLCYIGDSYQPARTAPVLVDLAEITKAIATEDTTGPQDLPTLPLSASSTWLQTPDNQRYDEQMAQYQAFTGLSMVTDGASQDSEGQFLSNLHGSGNLTNLIRRDGKLYGNLRNNSEASTILEWNTDVARDLQNRFRITTPASASATPVTQQPIETTAAVLPKIRLSPPVPIEPSNGVKQAPPRQAPGRNRQATPAPTRIEEAPAPPVVPAEVAVENAPAPPAAPATADRIAAEWARKFQARLVLDVQGKRVDLPAASPLPGGTFAVTAIHIPQSARGVSDEGLELVGRLKSLTELVLRTSDSQVTDNGVAKLAGLSSLKGISLHATQVTEKSLDTLKSLKSLEWIELGYNQNITDAAMDRLAAMPQLRGLNLASTRVTDAGVNKLVALKQLVTVDITGLKISDETIRSVKAQLPACEFFEGSLTRELFHPLLKDAIAAYVAGKRDILDGLVSKGEKELPDDIILNRKLRHLRKIFDPPVLQMPSEISPDAKSISLCQLKTITENTGWGPTQRNRVIPSNPAKEPFLRVGGTFFESGLYAHANSAYSFQLDGKWSSLSTKFGIQDDSGTRGSVIFIVKGDGKELFRSSTITPGVLHDQTIDITDVQLLELITDTTPNGGHSDWSVWLEPTLHRIVNSAK